MSSSFTPQIRLDIYKPSIYHTKDLTAFMAENLSKGEKLVYLSREWQDLTGGSVRKELLRLKNKYRIP